MTWGKGKAEYQGEFADGQFHGQGRHVWNDGCEYVGGANLQCFDSGAHFLTTERSRRSVPDDFARMC